MQHYAFIHRSRRISAARYKFFFFCLAAVATVGTSFGDFATSSFPGQSRDKIPSIFGFGPFNRVDSSGESNDVVEDPFLSDSPDKPSLDHRTDNMAGAPAKSAKISNVVRVVVEDGNELSLGTGTLVGVNEEHGFVVTNWHVVEHADAENCFVDFPDGFRSGATIMKTDDQWDLALLLIWKPNAEPMPLAPKIPQKGEQLTIAGYGQGPFRTELGQMTDFVAPNETAPFEMIEIEAMARQGDSGGPMINQNGELAAVLFGSGGGRTTGTHVDRLKQFLDSAFGAPPPPQNNPDVGPPPYDPNQQLAMNGYHEPARQPTEQTALHEPFPADQSIANGPPLDQPSVAIQNPPGSIMDPSGLPGNPALAALPVEPAPPSEQRMTPEDMKRNSIAALRNIPMARNPLGYSPADALAANQTNQSWQGQSMGYPNIQQGANPEFLNYPNRNFGSSPFGFFAIVGIFAAGFLFLPR